MRAPIRLAALTFAVWPASAAPAGGAVDPPAARAAAEAGRAEDQLAWGVALFAGEGVPADPDEAARWFARAAAQGLAEAQHRLASTYSTGRGNPKDPARAAAWWAKAAAQGHVEAQERMGHACEHGLGVPRSAAEAARWYRLAAGQGSSGAGYRLGRMLAEGRGPERNDAEAMSWLRRAADQGHPAAMLDVARLYAAGRGEPVNRVCAYFWTALAAVDWAFAAGLRDELRPRLSPAEAADAERLLAAARLEAGRVVRPLCPREPISIQLDGARLLDFAALLRHTTALEPDLSAVSAPEEVRVSARLEDLPWEEAYARLLASGGLVGAREGGRYVIRPAVAPPAN